MLARTAILVATAATLASTAAASSSVFGPLRGAPPSGPTHLRLLVSGSPPFVLDVDSGRATPISGIDVSDRPVITVLPVGRDAVVWVDHLAGDPAIYAVRHDALVARRIGSGLDAAASADGRAVWLKRS